MFVQDTANTIQIQHVEKDTVFVPKYINRDPMMIVSDSGGEQSCKEYIFSLLQDSSYVQNTHKSLFTQKTYCPPKMEMQLNNIHVGNDWIFCIIIFIVLLCALLTKFAKNTIFSFLQGCFSFNKINIITKDGSTINLLTLVPILFIFLPVISLLIYCIFNYYELWTNIVSIKQLNFINKNVSFAWVAIYVTTIVFYFFKVFLIKFFSWVFGQKKISNYYIQIHLNFSILIGFCVFLPVIFTIYSNVFYEKIFIFASLLIIVLLYVMKLIECFSMIIHSFKFSHIYLFLYLCIVELLPMIIGCKLLFF